MELKLVAVEHPDDTNIVVGQTHFIKTIEDVHELMVTSVPGVKFGLAFNEASGPCLVRHSGTDAELEQLAIRNSQAIGAGHTFTLIMRGAYPINVLTQLKALPEICSIFCATANPVSVVVAETETGRGVMGVIDGEKPKGIEGDKDIADRKAFLRKIGYKQ
ncbi:MAG: adenosine-specific kinase [candidate division WOR-3 bacterium]|nr:adenosine-specific kinase [candidate division WOR-3 bacterium]